MARRHIHVTKTGSAGAVMLGAIKEVADLVALHVWEVGQMFVDHVKVQDRYSVDVIVFGVRGYSRS